MRTNHLPKRSNKLSFCLIIHADTPVLLDFATALHTLLDGSFANMAVVGISAFLIVAGCAKAVEETKPAQEAAAVRVPAPREALQAAQARGVGQQTATAHIARLGRIIDTAMEQARSAAEHQSAASVRIDAAELAFNRLLREIGTVMAVEVRPSVEAARSAVARDAAAFSRLDRSAFRAAPRSMLAA